MNNPSVLKELSPEQKLYQLIISRLDGDRITSESYQEQTFKLVDKGIGGFIVFGGKRDEILLFIEKLQALSRIPLFIASDVERGVGQQLQGATCFPSQMAVAAAVKRSNPADEKLLERMIKAIAEEAIEAGINMPLMPVVDVNKNPNNPIICTRAFSDDPRKVEWFAVRYIKILEEKGLISCVKHFPGHGDTDTDSHMSLPVISKSRSDLMNVDIYPFIKVISTGASAIMVGHIAVTAFDDMPASLSEEVITNMLRKELEFKGLVLTDALSMSALHEFHNITVRCVNAGVDILLHPSDADAAVKELERAIDSGETDEKKINMAIERILKYKSTLKEFRKPFVNHKGHSDVATLLSDKSVTLVKGSSAVLPLKDLRDVSVVFSADENEHNISPLRNFISPVISIQKNEGKAARNNVIVSIFTSVAAWKGSSGIQKEEMHKIKEIIKNSKNSIVIAFGSPYVLQYLKEADVLIAVYDSNVRAQRSVIKCLTGEMKFSGSLPVSLSIS